MNTTDPSEPPGKTRSPSSFFAWLRLLLKGRESSLREAVEELMKEYGDRPLIPLEERLLLRNILKLHEKTVSDAMVPRVDIIAVEVNTPIPEVLRRMSEEAHSRIPVYRETLDNVVGMVHVKDLLPCVAQGRDCRLEDIVRHLSIVAPTMKVLDLLRQMRQSRNHMALIVDEYGGIDGLVTIEDLVEEIVGEIEDEYDVSHDPAVIVRPDGIIVADGRVPIEEFETKVGAFLQPAERENIDTVGGLVFSLAGRVPRRGEFLMHSSGMEFEVIEVDARSVKRVKVRRLKAQILS